MDAARLELLRFGLGWAKDDVRVVGWILLRESEGYDLGVQGRGAKDGDHS